MSKAEAKTKLNLIRPTTDYKGFGRVDLPSALVDAMKFIPPAVLTAIIVPSMLMPNSTLDLSYTNAYLVAGITAAFIAWRTKNLLSTIVIGMVVLWVWRFLTG